MLFKEHFFFLLLGSLAIQLYWNCMEGFRGPTCVGSKALFKPCARLGSKFCIRVLSRWNRVEASAVATTLTYCHIWHFSGLRGWSRPSSCHTAYRLYAIFELCILCARVLGGVAPFFCVQLPFYPLCATSQLLEIAAMRRPICKQPCTKDVLTLFTLSPWSGWQLCICYKHGYRTSGMQFNSSGRMLGSVLVRYWAMTKWISTRIFKSFFLLSIQHFSKS